MISGAYYPKINGSVVAVSNMMRSLILRNHKVTLVTRREFGSAHLEVRDGAKVLRVGTPGHALVLRASLSIQQFLVALREVHASPPDIIHAHGFTSLLAGAALGICSGRPVVVSFHGIQRLWSTEARWRGKRTLQLTLPVERFLLRLTRAIIAQSNLLKRIVVQLYDVPQEKVTVVPNPIDVKRFGYASPMPRESPVILFVGSFVRVHGPDLLLGSVPVILGQNPDSRVVMVGKGPLKTSLLQGIKDLEVGHSVELLDEVRDTSTLSKIYQSSRVVVIPLRYTGYILSLVGEEAMASGRPVVTTMTLDGELSRCGVMKAGIQPDSLGRVISSVLAWDDKQYDNVSVAARRYAEENFSLEAVGMKLEHVYETAIQEGRQVRIK